MKKLLVVVTMDCFKVGWVLIVICVVIKAGTCATAIFEWSSGCRKKTSKLFSSEHGRLSIYKIKMKTGLQADDAIEDNMGFYVVQV